VSRLCLRNGIKVLGFGNLSLLCSGVKESDAEAWKAVPPWLLDLRQQRIGG
jgi:hypothetical protein